MSWPRRHISFEDERETRLGRALRECCTVQLRKSKFQHKEDLLVDILMTEMVMKTRLAPEAMMLLSVLFQETFRRCL